MFRVRIHGRGGQGVVSAAEILSVAAFSEGNYAQAFPSFGSERMGAPIMAFCRIDNREIRLREPVMEPDALIIQDPTLLHHVDLFSGLTASGFVLINTARSLEVLGIEDLTSKSPRRIVLTVPATDIAHEFTGRPLPNAALLGGFAAMTGQLSIASVQSAIRSKFSGRVGDTNAAAALSAHDYVRKEVEAMKTEVSNA